MNIRIPLPPAWLLSNLIVLALVAGFLWLDKTETHWVIPSDTVKAAQFDQVRADGVRAVDDVTRDLNGLHNEVSAVSDRVSKLPTRVTTSGLVDDPEMALVRLSASVAILSLVQSKGGQQSAGSPQGKACVDYFLKGTGSFTECGFSRVQ